MGKSSSYTVEFINTGNEIEVEETETILHACIRNGLNQEYSCRVGMCLACIARIHEGEVKQPGAHGLSENEKEEYVLTCMARPKSDLKLERGVYPPSIEGNSSQTAIGDGGIPENEK